MLLKCPGEPWKHIWKRQIRRGCNYSTSDLCVCSAVLSNSVWIHARTLLRAAHNRTWNVIEMSLLTSVPSNHKQEVMSHLFPDLKSSSKCCVMLCFDPPGATVGIPFSQMIHLVKSQHHSSGHLSRHFTASPKDALINKADFMRSEAPPPVPVIWTGVG